MRFQFILTVWIVLLCHQIHCNPITDVTPHKDTSADSQPHDDEYYDDQFEPVEDLGDLDGTEPKEKKQSDGDLTQSGEVEGADPSAKPGAETPETRQEVDKSGPGSGKLNVQPEQWVSPEAGKKPAEPASAKKKSEETPNKKPEDKGQNGSLGKPAEETPIKKPQESSEVGAGKGVISSPEKKRHEFQKSPQNEGFKKGDQRQAEKIALGSKGPIPRDTGKTKNDLQKSKPIVAIKTHKGDFGKKALARIDNKPVVVSGSISDLLFAVGQRVNSFEDINKKLLPPVPKQSNNVSGRSVGPKLGAKSLPLTGKSLPLTGKSLPLSPKSLPLGPARGAPILGAKSLPSQEPPRRGGYSDDDTDDDSNLRLSPFARRKLAERLQKLYASKQPAAPASSKHAKTTSARPVTSNAGTEEYEKLLARRGQQLDELEEKDKPMIATKSLPPRLKSVSGTFEDIASQLSDNIKSVSAVNKDKLRSEKMKARGGPFPDTEPIYEEEDTTIIRRGASDPCPCYSKYSPLNMVRRTTKRVVRAVKTGTNMLYDVADAGLDKTKDLKDATRNDIVDPVVNMLPLISPAVTKIVDGGDAVADGTIKAAKGVVQGGKDLNEGFYNGIEDMLKKDKSCRCAEDTPGN